MKPYLIEVPDIFVIKQTHREAAEAALHILVNKQSHIVNIERKLAPIFQFPVLIVTIEVDPKEYELLAQWIEWTETCMRGNDYSFLLMKEETDEQSDIFITDCMVSLKLPEHLDDTLKMVISSNSIHENTPAVTQLVKKIKESERWGAILKKLVGATDNPLPKP